MFQSCTQVLEALLERQLGDDQQRASEAYRVACHNLFPHCLLFSPVDFQDSSAVISANGNESAEEEHIDTASEM